MTQTNRAKGENPSNPIQRAPHIYKETTLTHERVILLYAQKMPRWRALLLTVAMLVSSVVAVLAVASPAQADQRLAIFP